MSESPPVRNGKRNILIGVSVLAVAALLLTGYWAIFMRGIVTTDDARFDADLVDITPQVGGVLAALLVSTGDSVQVDQPLFQLDAASLKSRAEQADAAVESARAALEVAKSQRLKSVNGARPAEIEMAQATEMRTRTQVEMAEADWKRVEGLFAKNVVPASDRDHARAAWETAKHAHEEAQAHLALLRDGARKEDLSIAEQNVQLARARLNVAEASAHQAHINLEDAEVKAPFAGIVVRTWLEPGAMVSPGKPVLTLMNPATMHISANVEEKSLLHLAADSPVTISVDAYPGLHLKGRLSTIGRATNSRFSLIPSDGVSGSFIKVAQRIPIRIDLDRMPDLPLSPGLSVVVHINTRGSAQTSALAERHD